MRFEEYVQFIYLNSFLSMKEVKELAVDLWNHGVDKHEALRVARSK